MLLVKPDAKEHTKTQRTENIPGLERQQKPIQNLPAKWSISQYINHSKHDKKLSILESYHRTVIVFDALDLMTSNIPALPYVSDYSADLVYYRYGRKSKGCTIHGPSLAIGR